MTYKGLRCGIMRVSGLPYVNEGEVKNVIDSLKDWSGAKYVDK